MAHGRTWHAQDAGARGLDHWCVGQSGDNAHTGARAGLGQRIGRRNEQKVRLRVPIRWTRKVMVSQWPR
ncbi:hypothetical protein DVV14_25020 (plasmid) [Vibrio coralliilyticus]|nr:hypothetical protein DVV14_25020 [Vibrio coralliilyticus]